VQAFSPIARALSARDAGQATATLTVLSRANLPKLTGHVLADGSTRFCLK